MKLKTNKAAFAAEFIDIEKAAEIVGARWEPFQFRMLNDTGRKSIDNKSRQIAWSFSAALDAVLDGMFNSNTPHVFVSINREEAMEKIRYAKVIVEAIDEPARPKIIYDSKTEIELGNKSRMTSHPCKAVRGKARTRVYLDEMAHYPKELAKDIYRAALPATIKGDGYMRIGSSPTGAGGLFWELITESMKSWPGFTRNTIPWWSIRSLCNDVGMARQFAPDMTTEDRVRRYGTLALIEVFEGMFLEDFQQEFECDFVDETTAWISWEIIKRNQNADHVWFSANGVDEALSMIPLIAQAQNVGTVEPTLTAGLDVGRHRHLTELLVTGKTTTGHMPLRLRVSLDRVEYDDQQACFTQLFKALPFTSVLIDRNGIGNQLAENLEREFPGMCEGVNFTNATKELWAVQARISFERAYVPIPLDRELAYQIHSIKKRVTAAGNSTYDTEGNEKHHADQFWALALAVWAQVGGVDKTMRVI